MRAFLAFKKKHCPSCATGRGTTRPTMTTAEQQTQRKQRYVTKKLQGSNQGTNVSGKNLDSGTLREIVSNPAVGMRTDSKAEHKDAVNKSRWNSIIRALFNYKSFPTGETEKQKVLNAHHLVARSIAPHRTYDPNNWVLITKEQHVAFHNLYGRTDPTGELFEKWATENYGITEFPWKRADQDKRVLNIIKNLEKERQGREKKVKELTLERGHEIVNEVPYVGQRDETVLYCKEHKVKQMIFWSSYCRKGDPGRKGLRCCSPPRVKSREIARAFKDSPLITRFFQIDIQTFDIYLDTFEKTGDYTRLHKDVTWQAFRNNPDFYLKVPDFGQQ